MVAVAHNGTPALAPPLVKAGPAGLTERSSVIFRFCCLFLIAGLVSLSGCAALKSGQDLSRSEADTAGIAIEKVHPTAGGQMLDMRYRVTDPEKAKHSLKRGAQVYLLDQASGMKLPVPNMAMVGRLMQHPDQAGSNRIFWIMFSNPGATVKQGARVTLVIDDIRIRDIVVQ
jgi:hypothetical protein